MKNTVSLFDVEGIAVEQKYHYASTINAVVEKYKIDRRDAEKWVAKIFDNAAMIRDSE